MIRPILLIAAVVFVATGQDNSQRSVVVRIGDVTAPGSRSSRDIKGGAPFQLPVPSLQPGEAVPALQVRFPGMKSSATLSFHEVSFDGKTLQATVTLENGTGATLDNARMLITRVTEDVRREGAGAGEAANKRYLRVDMAAPIVFGDIGKDSKSEECTLTITGFHQNQDTVRTTVEGVILDGRN